MYSTTLAVLNDIRFYGLLLKFDQNLAAKVRDGRCPACGAALHSAPYLRKPHGGPPGLGEEHRKRLSLCCAADGCRQRATPPSLRFLGPKVYWGAWVIRDLGDVLRTNACADATAAGVVWGKPADRYTLA